jgi:hypothetical protein
MARTSHGFPGSLRTRFADPADRFTSLAFVDALAIVNGAAVLALVVVTGYYAWQTREMAKEMRRARVLSLLPKLVLDVKMVGPTFGLIVVRNVGAGPALNADLTLTLAEGEDGGREERQWLAHVIAPGEEHEFLPPQDVDGMNELVSRHPTIGLRGTFRDAFDHEQIVAERIDIAEAWESLAAARRRFQEDPATRVVRELEKARKAVETIGRELAAVTTIVQHWWRDQRDEETN